MDGVAVAVRFLLFRTQVLYQTPQSRHQENITIHIFSASHTPLSRRGGVGRKVRAVGGSYSLDMDFTNEFDRLPPPPPGWFFRGWVFSKGGGGRGGEKDKYSS